MVKRDELTKRDLHIINTFFSMKNMIFTPFSLNFVQKPMTIGGHNKPPLLAIRPLHIEKCYNGSRILRINLKDSIENEAPNLFFRDDVDIDDDIEMNDVDVENIIEMNDVDVENIIEMK
ncbi:hypothetical protein HKD37_20G056084 [Glycine soja]